MGLQEKFIIKMYVADLRPEDIVEYNPATKKIESKIIVDSNKSCQISYPGSLVRKKGKVYFDTKEEAERSIENEINTIDNPQILQDTPGPQQFTYIYEIVKVFI